ncbi:hypothetical protein COU75_04020 [Candidatus Peregrinibacteria bacterium CG10_big_fil_rev_8_21_14_0_10_42_8]|nr:MAG: hypothetical protein COU75_04020 [Candidatus Peregrinibacteria bacterium CG10_big_fil_rev_8_21_14_0_10_42_8]
MKKNDAYLLLLSMKHILLISAFTLSLSAGYLSGRTIVSNPAGIIIQADTRPLVPTIHIEGVRNGLLHGSIKGNARMTIGKTVFTESGIFAIDAADVFVNTVHVIIPDGMQFVASKRGKKYYPVFSTSANRMALKNRLYFRTAEEAESAGYEA